ncbi:MAG: hypothetical protein BRC29_03950 [Nanohaloarchaea archaeon SW_7_43_1]|nr:MAG: hypothetical protein BRC29_03950 [Nanohaloarchaea archaeon SW_7_43_1]
MSDRRDSLRDYQVYSVLGQVNKDLMMDVRGSIYETFEVAPEHAQKTAKKLDDSYEGAFSDPWNTDYNLEYDHVSASFEKEYSDPNELSGTTTVALDPSHKKVLNPFRADDIKVEISGVMDIKPKNFLELLKE